ncbi:hypothetical protein BCV71DRAFT_177240, partial [Rhizopus microsporus]
ILGIYKGTNYKSSETSVCDKDGGCLGEMYYTEKGQEGLTNRAMPGLPRFLIDWLG